MAKLLKYGQYFVVLCCTVVFIYMLRDFNSANMGEILAHINYGWIFVAMVFAAVNILFKVFRLFVIAEQFNYKSPLELIYKTQVVSLIFALLTPGRVGEVSKLYLLSQKRKEKYPVVTSIMLYELLVDFFCISSISLLFVIFAMKNLIISLIIFIFIVFAVMSAAFIGKGSKYVTKLPESVQDFFKYISSNRIKLRYKWYYTLPLSGGAWVLDGFFQYYILKSVNIGSEVFMLVALSAISSIVAIISILPLGFGVTDLSSLYLYYRFQGLNKETILFLVNSSRLFLVLTLFLLAIPFFRLLIKRNWFSKPNEELGENFEDKLMINNE
jgi:uncharacterized protein (TIRG00374 family)